MNKIRLMDVYTDTEFREIVEASNSYKDCLEKLGYCSNSGDSTHVLQEKIRMLEIPTNHFHSSTSIKRTRETVFCKDSTCDQSTLRRYFAKEDIIRTCSICGQPPEWNNKPLTLILDHINGINHDNRLENLRLVCPNCNIQLETTNARNPIRLDKKYALCEDCGKPISKLSKKCTICAHKQVTKVHITREELKNRIRHESFEEIGRSFQVTGNSIKKWCDKYSLPRTKVEINKYSNEDWEQV